MITLCRRRLRYEDRASQQLMWLTFYQAAGSPLTDSFGCLVRLDEIQLPPSRTLRTHPDHRAELITYLLEGALGYQDSRGRARWIRAGEFRYLAAAASEYASGTNASASEQAHVFQIGIRSAAELRPNEQQQRFTVAERRGAWCLVAAPGKRGPWLQLQEDARVYSAVLDAGQHLVHALDAGRRAWLHVLRGEVALHDLTLSSGDGAGITTERSIAITSINAAELILIDLA